MLPQSLTSLEIVSSNSQLTYWSTFLKSVVQCLPELHTLKFPLGINTPLSSTDLLCLPPSLTRFSGHCTPTVEELLHIPTAITDLKLDWDRAHLPHLPRHLTCLILQDSVALTNTEISALPQSITKLRNSCTAIDVKCFEHLPLRDWALTLNTAIDFQGNFPQLTKLAISGPGGGKTVYVPATVQTLRLYSYIDTVFPPELRLGKFFGRAINSVAVIEQGQFSQCFSCDVRSTTFTDMSNITMHLMVLSPRHLIQLMLSFSSTVPLPELVESLYSFTNLKRLELFQVGRYSTDPIQHYGQVIRFPAGLLKLSLQGNYWLSRLELPRSLRKLHLRSVDINSAVLHPLHNLRSLRISLPQQISWTSDEVAKVLDHLPARMRSIILNIKIKVVNCSVRECCERYRTDHTRYLSHLSIDTYPFVMNGDPIHRV